jgi:AAA+ superfamily predicted ATPase
MKGETMMKELQYYLKAGFPAIWIKTWEESRAIEEIACIAKGESPTDSLELKVWSITKGFVDYTTKQADGAEDPFVALNSIEEGTELTIYTLLNFHFFLENPLVLQKIKDLIPHCKQKGKHMIFISPKVTLPVEIEKEITVINFELPSREDLEHPLDIIIRSINGDLKEEPDRKALTEAALGLTLSEAENAFAFAYVKHRHLGPEAIQTVQKEKANVIKKNGILEYIQPEFSLDNIGGLTELKKWLLQRKKAFSEEAKAFGLPSPRGVLLVGVPGAGKSLTAKAVSAAWELPLLRFDVGKVFGSLVGQSEEQMRIALQTAEAVSPCILWIDEIDKCATGMASSGSTDSGVTARVFGTLLTWMQEKKKPVFVFATANSISSLPAEMLRKGRFDELFFVDLPNEEERKEIFEIHIKKRGRDPKSFDLAILSSQSNGFGGAEIEEAVISGLYTAFSEGRDLTTLDILTAIRQTTPLSKSMEESISKTREWARTRARNASSLTEINETEQKRRIM